MKHLFFSLIVLGTSTATFAKEPPKLFKKADDKLQEELDRAREEAKDALDNLKDDVAKGRDNIKDELERLKEKHRDRAEQLIEDAKDLGHDVKEDVRNSADKERARLDRKIEDIEDKIRDKFGNLKDQHKEFLDKRWAFAPRQEDGKLAGYFLLDLETNELYILDFDEHKKNKTRKLSIEQAERFKKAARIEKSPEMLRDLRDISKEYASSQGEEKSDEAKEKINEGIDYLVDKIAIPEEDKSKGRYLSEDDIFGDETH